MFISNVRLDMLTWDFIGTDSLLALKTVLVGMGVNGSIRQAVKPALKSVHLLLEPLVDIRRTAG